MTSIFTGDLTIIFTRRRKIYVALRGEMYKSWFELYKDNRNAAILTVTRALHPECRNKTQLKKFSRLAGDTFYETYPRLDSYTLSPELLSDHELLTRLDALASLDKALPVKFQQVVHSI